MGSDGWCSGVLEGGGDESGAKGQDSTSFHRLLLPHSTRSSHPLTPITSSTPHLHHSHHHHSHHHPHPLPRSTTGLRGFFNNRHRRHESADERPPGAVNGASGGRVTETESAQASGTVFNIEGAVSGWRVIVVLLVGLCCYSTMVQLTSNTHLPSPPHPTPHLLTPPLPTTPNPTPPHPTPPSQAASNGLHAKRLVYYKEHPEVTMVFSDLVGYTALSSTKHPADLLVMLHEFFEQLGDVVEMEGAYKYETGEGR